MYLTKLDAVERPAMDTAKPYLIVTRGQDLIDHFARQADIVSGVAHCGQRFVRRVLCDLRHAAQDFQQCGVAFDCRPAGIVDDIVRGLPPKGGCKAHHDGFRDDQSVRRVEVLAHPVFLHFEARQDLDRVHQRGGSGDKGSGQGDQLKFVRAAATFMICNMPPSIICTSARTVSAATIIISVLTGFRFCGIVLLEPRPGRNGS